MKTLTILFVTVIMMGVGCSKNEDSENNPDRPNKPSPLPDLPDPDDVCSCMDDIIFMQYCYDNFDVNKDGKVSVIEANAARKIDINSECASVKGIERFPNIEILSLNGSSITELDLRYNLKLKSLSCQDRQLTTVLLPNTLMAIAFNGCSSLTEIHLPDNLTSIGESSFYDCSSLTEIHLPASLTSIGGYAFDQCTSLMKVMCYALTPPTISGRFLFGFAHSGHLLYNRSENLYVPAESIQAYKESPWASDFKNILPIE